MRNIILKIALFIIPAVVFSFVLDSFISRNLARSYTFADGEFPVWNALFNSKINSDIVIFGASNALRGVDPAILSRKFNLSAYNLAVNGLNFRFQYLRYHLLLEYDRKPTVIIQTINAVSFEKPLGLYNPDQFLPYMYRNKKIENALSGYKDYTWIDFYFPVLRYFGKKESLLSTLKLLTFPSSNKPYRINGFLPKDEQWNEDLAKAKAITPHRKFILDTILVSEFERFILDCRRKNISLVFVNLPEYIEGQDYISNRDEMMADFFRFSKEYNIPFLNYLNDSVSYNKKYFFNSGHLNKIGAELMTNRLIDDLDKCGFLPIK